MSTTLQRLSIAGAAEGTLEQEAVSASVAVTADRPVAVYGRQSALTVQRQMLIPQPAGGCGLCHGPQRAGGIAHTLIQTEFEILHPLGLTEFPFSSPTDDNGRLDLALATPTGLEIGEIKPANPEGYARGVADMSFYTTALQATFPRSTIRPLTRVLPPEVGIFPNPQVPACPPQVLHVNPPVDGVYGYYCAPSYAELIRNPNCRCNRRRQSVPETVPVPASEPERQRTQQPVPARRAALEEIAEFVRRVVQSGEDAEAAARQFLNEHPEVRNILIGAAVAIIVATIAEDILTLGAGLLDDPASIAIALALVRVAQSGR